MAIVYKDCDAGEAALVYTCDPCLVPEMGRVRSIMLIKKGTTVTVPLNLSTFTASVEAGDIIVIPETIGSFDGGTPVIVPGYGDIKERKSGDNYILAIKDPHYANNTAFWAEAEKHVWNIAFRSETQLHVVTSDVTVTAKAPIEEDLESTVVWNVEAKWFSKTKPTVTPVSVIATMLKCFEITA